MTSGYKLYISFLALDRLPYLSIVYSIPTRLSFIVRHALLRFPALVRLNETGDSMNELI